MPDQAGALNDVLPSLVSLSQFHPEASGGPEDTGFLFQKFIDKCREYKRFGKADSIYQTGPVYRFGAPLSQMSAVGCRLCVGWLLVRCVETCCVIGLLFIDCAFHAHDGVECVLCEGKTCSCAAADRGPD